MTVEQHAEAAAWKVVISDPFLSAVRFVAPYGLALFLTVALMVSCAREQLLEKEAIRRNLATYDERGNFTWKDQK